MREQEGGFSMVELLVTVTIFALVSVAFYQVLFAGTRGSRTSRNVARISEEARLGLNRMIRDTREADKIANPTATSYQAYIDFNNDQQYQSPNAQGDYEIETFTLSGTSITLNGSELVSGVSKIGTAPVFQFSSNALDYDWDADGVTTLAELQNSASFGVVIPDPNVLISNVSYSMKITSGGSTANFFGQAELRNNLR